MFFSKFGGDPNDCHGLQTRCVGHQLAKVSVVRLFNLVLNKNPRVIGGVPTQDVSPEGANFFFLGFYFELHTNCVG